MDGLKGVGFVIGVLVNVAVAHDAEPTAIPVLNQFDVARDPVPVGVLLGVCTAFNVAIPVIVDTYAPLSEGVPVKVVLVDPYTGVVGQDGLVQYAGMGFGIENIRSVQVLLPVGVAIPVPVVGIAVVVDGFVIPGHGVDVKHRQHAHGGNAHEEDHPR